MMIDRAKELLASGQVSRVLGWEQGEHSWDRTPAFFDGGNIENLKYDGFCGPNVSKYLVGEAAKEGTVLAFLKPCDSWSFNQLATEHRINTEKVYAIGVGCRGKVYMEDIAIQGHLPHIGPGVGNARLGHALLYLCQLVCRHHHMKVPVTLAPGRQRSSRSRLRLWAGGSFTLSSSFFSGPLGSGEGGRLFKMPSSILSFCSSESSAVCR